MNSKTHCTPCCLPACTAGVTLCTSNAAMAPGQDTSRAAPRGGGGVLGYTRGVATVFMSCHCCRFLLCQKQIRPTTLQHANASFHSHFVSLLQDQSKTCYYPTSCCGHSSPSPYDGPFTHNLPPSPPPPPPPLLCPPPPNEQQSFAIGW